MAENQDSYLIHNQNNCSNKGLVIYLFALEVEILHFDKVMYESSHKINMSKRKKME